MTTERTLEPLIINGNPMPYLVAANEDDEEQRVLPFDATYEVLEAWKALDPDHRNFGWTGSADNTEPETAFVVFLDPAGKLCTEFVSPFFDGVSTLNAYAVDELESIPGIDVGEQALIHQLRLTAAQHNVLGSLHNPFLKYSSGSEEIPAGPQAVEALEVKDDNHVALYTIQPDGDYIVESLEEGFNYGWTTFDSEGYELDEDHNRVSDEPNPDWV